MKTLKTQKGAKKGEVEENKSEVEREEIYM